MYRILLIIFSTLFLVACSEKEGKWTPDNLVDPYTVDKGHYVLDELKYLRDDEKDSLNAICDRLNKHGNLETAIVLLDDIDIDSFDFGYKLYNRWGLGRDDRGILLLIVMEQHVWQFISGYGAEGDYPDAMLRRIGEERIVPQFRKGEYYEGLRDAFKELSKIACDTTYRISLSQASKLGGTSEDDEEKLWVDKKFDELVEWAEETDFTTWAWIMTFIYILGGLMLTSLVVCFVMQLAAIRLSDIKAEMSSERRSDKYGSLTYTNQNQEMYWSVWGRLGCLRYFIIDLAFIGAIYIARMEDTLTYALLGLWLFFAYGSIVWTILAIIQISKAENDVDKYARADAVVKSVTIKIQMVFAPLTAIPFYLIMRTWRNKIRSRVIKCPICGGALNMTGNGEYEPLSDIEKFEVENNIRTCEMYACENGHEVALMTHGADYGNYSDCPSCGAHAYREIRRETSVEPTYTSKGVQVKTFECLHCKCQHEENDELPMLVHHSGGGRSSSGGGGSYHRSGGTRGGGRSGGGGARGRW